MPQLIQYDLRSKGKSIFESVVETQSYVVRGFKKMAGLPVFILLGYLEARKLDFVPGAGAAGGCPLFTLHTCWNMMRTPSFPKQVFL